MGRDSVSRNGGDPVVFHIQAPRVYDEVEGREANVEAKVNISATALRPSAPPAYAPRRRSCCCCPASLASCTVKLAKALIPLTISFAAGAVLDHFYGTRVIRSVEAVWP